MKTLDKMTEKMNKLKLDNGSIDNDKEFEKIVEGITGIDISMRENDEYKDIEYMIEIFEINPELTIVPVSMNKEHKEFYEFCKKKFLIYREEICFDISDIMYSDLNERQKKEILRFSKIMSKLNKYTMKDKYDLKFYSIFCNLLILIKEFMDRNVLKRKKIKII